ncbi:Saccharolysin [Dactylella cylindrospora]|nr:Saccharolysin [Dactylella cylindrospora]
MQPAITSRLASRTLLRRRVLSSTPRPTSSNYICNDCLRKSRGFRHLQHKASSSAAIQTQPSISSIPPPFGFDEGDKHNDKLLRDIFDSPAAYKDFTSGSSRRSTGLFQNRYLTSPHGFETFAEISLRKARRVVERVSSATSREEFMRVIKDLDRLSDLLCRVLDLSDFVRNTHPDMKIVQAADAAYSKVYEYMNVLNTTTALYDTLKIAMKDPEVVQSFGEEEHTVARTLLADFEKSGINLPPYLKRRFVELSNDIARLGPRFVSAAAASSPYLMFDSTQLGGLDPWTVSNLSRISGSKKVYLPTRGSIALQALQSVKNEQVRREIYVSHNKASGLQIHILEEMLRKRAELAKLVGSSSYATMTLADKMAKSPEAVGAFLASMLVNMKPMAMKEVERIADMKRRQTGRQNLEAWDKDYYFHKLVESEKSRFGSLDLSAYFSLGTVMQGLSRLFTRLYGLKLVPHETLSGETWNEDVRRLDVISESEGHIAVVYCDLFQRDGKNPNPAHFTVRCSRAIEEEEIEEELLNEGGSDGMASATNKNGVLFQLPTIALICDFATTPGSTAPLLNFHEVSTLFHEMGHAIHSILGRTKYHEVAGTRCPTDFAEFPSILMEHFAKSPEVLALYARHHLTDEPLPQKLLEQRLAVGSLIEHSETYQQVILALLDQRLHSQLAGDSSFDSTEIYQGLEQTHGLFPAIREVSWQGYFTHLFGYGSLYYSYMLDKAIADKVWKEVFKGDPLSREAGEKYKNEVLKWGGSRDPWKCIGRLLGREDLENPSGGRMGEVGKWGCEAHGVSIEAI